MVGSRPSAIGSGERGVFEVLPTRLPFWDWWSSECERRSVACRGWGRAQDEYEGDREVFWVVRSCCFAWVLSSLLVKTGIG